MNPRRFTQSLVAATVLMLAAATSTRADDACPSTSDNGQFTLKFLGIERNGNLVTYKYEICDTHAGGSGLSHWNLAPPGLRRMRCVRKPDWRWRCRVRPRWLHGIRRGQVGDGPGRGRMQAVLRHVR